MVSKSVVVAGSIVDFCISFGGEDIYGACETSRKRQDSQLPRYPSSMTLVTEATSPSDGSYPFFLEHPLEFSVP